MRIALLTTQTTHHAYFARSLAESHPLEAIVIETRLPTPSFDVRHPFEDRRDEYERDVLLGGAPVALDDIAAVEVVDSANDAEVALRVLSPDVVLVFGTGKLLPPVVSVPRAACLNLHGGDPERYRGLDTHLWAIYHRDFAGLVTTLHHVDAGLDTGDIVLQAPVPLRAGMELHELRAANTRVCVELSRTALDAIVRDGVASHRPPAATGRYYSFMPSVLKELCVTNFRRHVETL